MILFILYYIILELSPLLASSLFLKLDSSLRDDSLPEALLKSED